MSFPQTDRVRGQFNHQRWLATLEAIVSFLLRKGRFTVFKQEKISEWKQQSHFIFNLNENLTFDVIILFPQN